VVVEVVVRWGDMDALGHVNNTVYLEYFQTAHIIYMERLGLNTPGPEWRQAGLIMAASTCRYKAPMTYPDTLSVGSRVAAIGEDHLLMEQVAVSQKSGTVVADGEVTVVSYDYGAGCRVSSPRLGVLGSKPSRDAQYRWRQRERGGRRLPNESAAASALDPATVSRG